MDAVTLERTLTELDHVRLLNLLRRAAGGDGPATHRSALAALLDNAELVPPQAVAPDVVTMQSQVLLHDLQTGERTTLTLCYPSDAQPASGHVSVLSPVGSALLGLRVGATASWSTPGGDPKRAELLAVLFQPEASGDHAA